MPPQSQPPEQSEAPQPSLQPQPQPGVMAPFSPEQPLPPKRGSKAAVGIILGVIALIIAFIIFGMFHFAHHATKNTDNLTTATSWQTYTSTQYGFSQSFPGSPTVSTSSMTIQGISMPTTIFERNNGGNYFATKVVSYPSNFDMSDTDARLQAALNSSVQNMQGAKLTSTSFIQLAGYRALAGVITVTQGNLSLQQHETALLKGHTMFLFISSAASASDYATFTSSFKFN